MREAARDRRPDTLTWVESYAAAALDERALTEFAARVNREITSEVPQITADAGLRRDLETSTHDAIRTYLSRAPHDPPGALDPPPAARDLGRTLAQRGHDVSVLLRVYRVGLRCLWRQFMADICRAQLDDEQRADVLDFLWDHLSRTVEHVIEELVGVFLDEVEHRMSGAAARRVETVHALLRDEPMDPDVASQRLAHNLHRQQTGLVLWVDNDFPHPDPIALLDSHARDIATQLGAARPLTIPSGPRALWAWLATAPRPDLGALPASDNLRVATGVPASGLTGFRTTHTEAVMAQTVAIDSASAASVTHYQDVELISCMSANPAAMRTLVTRELADLAGPEPANVRLRETVLVYLNSGSSARAAETLGVHKNTILYRLQQAETLLGHKIDERKLQLEIALRIATTYGDPTTPH
jgi:hypothetical protein